MEKAILDQITVNDEQLNELAQHRARAVRDWLSKKGIADERLFLVSARPSEGRAQAPGSRVDQALK